MTRDFFELAYKVSMFIFCIIGILILVAVIVGVADILSFGGIIKYGITLMVVSLILIDYKLQIIINQLREVSRQSFK